MSLSRVDLAARVYSVGGLLVCAWCAASAALARPAEVEHFATLAFGIGHGAALVTIGSGLRRRRPSARKWALRWVYCGVACSGLGAVGIVAGVLAVAARESGAPPPEHVVLILVASAALALSLWLFRVLSHPHVEAAFRPIVGSAPTHDEASPACRRGC